MFCGKCGKQINDDALSCPYCEWVVEVIPNIDSVSKKTSAEKEILIISERVPELTLIQIVTNTNLEIEEAETAINNLVNKGIAEKSFDDSLGQYIYKFKNNASKKLQEKRDSENGKGFLVIIVLLIIGFFLFRTCTG